MGKHARAQRKHTAADDVVVYDATGWRTRLRGLGSGLGRNKRLLTAAIAAAVAILLVGWAVFAFIDGRRVLTYDERFDRDLQLAESAITDRGTPQQQSDRYVDLGMAQYNNGEYKKAVTSYKKALDLNSKDKRQIMPALADAYAAAGDRDAAIKTVNDLLEYLKGLPDDPAAQAQVEQQEAQLKALREGKL